MGLLTYLKLRTCLSASLITVKEGERTPMTSIYVIASLIFLFTVSFMVFIMTRILMLPFICLCLTTAMLHKKRRKDPADPVEHWMAYVGNHDNFLM